MELIYEKRKELDEIETGKQILDIREQQVLMEIKTIKRIKGVLNE